MFDKVTSVISLLDQPAAVIDVAGDIRAFNSAFGACFEDGPGALVGSALSDLLVPGAASSLGDYLERASVVADPDWTFQTKLRSKASSMTLSIKPIVEGGALSGLLCQSVSLSEEAAPRLHFFMEYLDQGVWDYDIRSDFFVVSDTWREMRGIGIDDPLSPPDEHWLAEIHPDDRELLSSMFAAVSEGKVETINLPYRRKHRQKGHWIWLHCRGKVMEVDRDGRPTRIVGTDTDLTDFKAKEAELEQLASKLQLAIEASGMGIWEYDHSTHTVYWDDRLLEMFGITDGENRRSGDEWISRMHPEDGIPTQAYADECERRGIDILRDYRVIKPDGEIRHLRTMARVIEPTGEVGKLIGVNFDVTADYRHASELEHARQQLEYDSRHDALTGLANRRLLDETMAAFIEDADKDSRYAVLHVDLDHFKRINDTLGHAAGDAVLTHVGDELRRLVPDHCLICRVGGDEFVVLYTQAPSDKTLEALSAAIIETFKEPFDFQGHACVFGASIGLAIGTGRPETHSEVFIKADLALYAAKDSGRSCFRFFTPQIKSDSVMRLHGRQHILDAIQSREITCFYQPQYDGKTLEIVGAEALVRWRCPRRGLLAPAQFMPMVQDAGLVPRIDECILQQVLETQTRWTELGIAFPPISLNVSRERMAEKGLGEDMRNMIKPHHKVSFELLETAFLDQAEGTTRENLELMRALGVEIELDDFGSGHSSVVALQVIKPARVKIDQMLVAPISTTPSQILTLQALSKIARLEGIGVVVEGIETDKHLVAIRSVDCDRLQGFALSRPMDEESFRALYAGRSNAQSVG